MRLMVLSLILSASALLAEDRPTPEWLTGEDYSVASQASERIPPPNILGVTNARFQWTPGYLDVPIYLWQKYHVRVDAWLQKHQAFISKYLPSVIKYAVNYESEKNYIILTAVGIAKYLKKF